MGKSDLKVSVIGLGTGQFGAKAWGYQIRFNDNDIIKVVKRAIELGINVFDTAEIYGDGVSERLLGEALRGYDRDDFTIISKVAPWNLRYGNVIKAAERSLRRLNVRFIDLYLVHHPNPLVPMKETFRALEELVKRGMVGYIGVSNFNERLLRKAMETLSSTEIVANEIEYNILCRSAEKHIIPYCIKENIGIIAYSPLAGGILTGEYSFEKPPKDRARAFNFLARKSFLKKCEPLFKVLREIARERNVTVSQIALYWIVRKPQLIAIPAALTPKQIEENAKASDITLTSNEIKKIEEVAPSLGLRIYAFDHYVIRPISWIKGTIRHVLF